MEFLWEITEHCEEDVSTIELNCEKNILNLNLNFQWQKLLKFRYLSHIRSKSHEIISKKSHSLKA